MVRVSGTMKAVAAPNPSTATTCETSSACTGARSPPSSRCRQGASSTPSVRGGCEHRKKEPLPGRYLIIDARLRRPAGAGDGCELHVCRRRQRERRKIADNRPSALEQAGVGEQRDAGKVGQGGG